MALPSDVTVFSLTFGHATNGYTDATGVVVLPGTKVEMWPVDLVTGKRLVVTHVATGQVIVPAAVEATIDGEGKATIGPLPHTDNPTLSPIGFGYRVEWQVASGRRRAAPENKTFAVPMAAGASVDFDLLDVADAVPGVLVPMGIATGLADTVVAGLIPGPSATATALAAASVAAVQEAITDGVIVVGPGGDEMPTLEDLERAALLGTISTTQVMRLGPTSFDQRIGGLTLATAAAVAASDTNYWRISLLRLRPGQNPLTIVSRTTKATGGEAFTADQGWNYDAVQWLETARHLRKGDVLALSFTKTGTPADLVAVTAAVRYEPGVQPVIRDTFTRADSASVLGTTDTGQAWEAPLAGTFGLASGKGYASALSSGFAYDLFNAGRSDYTLSVIISTAGSSQGLVFRAVDYNNLWDAGSGGVSKTAGGVTTSVIGGIGGLVTGDVLTVAVSGPSISLYKNGLFIGSATDAFNQTATKVGIWTADTSARLDDLTLAA